MIGVGRLDGEYRSVSYGATHKAIRGLRKSLRPVRHSIAEADT